MDEIDQKLLKLLKQNARAPVLDLARRIGLSRSATQARLGKLVSTGRIRSFTIAENEARKQNTAHFLVKLANDKACLVVVPALKSLDSFSTLHSIAGEYDLIVRLDVDDVSGIESTRARIVDIPGVAEVKTYLSLEAYNG
jgi:Lrp/AsnC family transcriptional regulator, leucine-responsive regulatory protein